MAIEFKGRWFEKEFILQCVRWYVAYPLSYRQLEDLMEERGVDVDHSTINRWVLKYAPELEEEFRKRKKPVGSSWRAAFQKLFVKAQFHEPGEITIRSEPRKRGPGRPRTEQEGSEVFFLDKFRIRKELSESRRAILEGACFVIGTNDLRETASPEEILHIYMKEQQGVERGFRFLKDPTYFADAFFLKSPRRVAALLCVMTIALISIH